MWLFLIYDWKPEDSRVLILQLGFWTELLRPRYSVMNTHRLFFCACSLFESTKLVTEHSSLKPNGVFRSCIWLGDRCLSGRWTHNEVEQNVSWASNQSTKHKTIVMVTADAQWRYKPQEGSNSPSQTGHHTNQHQQEVLSEGRTH